MDSKDPFTGSVKAFYSLTEVATEFGVSHKTVYRWLERGQLKASPALRRKMITIASIKAFIETANQGGAR